MKNIKAVTIAATKSGAGKTTLTLGILAALIRRGLDVQPFKSGPDFIDPTLHSSVTKKTSYNLDLNMMGRTSCRKTFYKHALCSDISVLEGVMGLYDGGEASTASLAKLLGIPVILIIDAQSSAQSSVAVLTGFQMYDPEVEIAGVIFNKIGSDRHKQLIDQAVVEKSSVPVIGYMPRDIAFEIPERHLGLHMGDENPLSSAELDRLAETVENHLNLDLLLNAETSVDSRYSEERKNTAGRIKRRDVRMAVAIDRAFCFYYRENFEILERAGFEIVPFSPLTDRIIPDDCSMIYLGGGYPELYARQLSENTSMRANLRRVHKQGVPIYGECGGFMYLCDRLVDMDGNEFSMAGVFPFKTVMNRRLRKLGYRKALLMNHSALGAAGSVVHGHEFHYSHIEHVDIDRERHNIRPLYTLDNNSYEGYYAGSAMGSYIHLHFGRTPEIADSLYNHILTDTRS